jgi:SpoVK/Ycf46/Vps4 family AAA+-type ATPase
MARADLLVSLAKAASRGEHELVRRAIEALAAEERAKQHHVLADQLIASLRQNGHLNSLSATAPDQVANLLWESNPNRDISDLVLPAEISSACRELVEEHHRSDLLRSYGFEPRHRMLLVGAPGTGKTSLASALATALLMPLITVRYEAVIGSYLGETASRLERVFAHSRSRRCVLFLDEFDTVGKERGDLNETGEIKRVVSSLLLQIDSLPSHVVVVAATNHPELLDRAAWRRFQLRLYLPMPGYAERLQWFHHFAEHSPIPLKIPLSRLARAMTGASFAEIEELATDIVRRCILAGPDCDISDIVRTRIQQWKTRFQGTRPVVD